MKPYDKAEHLILKFMFNTTSRKLWLNKIKEAMKYSTIIVDEIITVLKSSPIHSDLEITYWENVKKEIIEYDKNYFVINHSEQ